MQHKVDSQGKSFAIVFILSFRRRFVSFIHNHIFLFSVWRKGSGLSLTNEVCFWFLNEAPCYVFACLFNTRENSHG